MHADLQRDNAMVKNMKLENGSTIKFDDRDMSGYPDISALHEAIKKFNRNVSFGKSYVYSYTITDIVEYQGHTHYISDRHKENMGQGMHMMVIEFECGRILKINPDRYRQYYTEESASFEDEPKKNVCPGCSQTMEEICRWV